MSTIRASTPHSGMRTPVPSPVVLGSGGGSPKRRSTSRIGTPLFEEVPVSVNVAVRIRPLLEAGTLTIELPPTKARSSVIDSTTCHTVTVVSPSQKKKFVFDNVFDENTTQEGVWRYLSSCIPSLMQGYNVSIMAYGQSGSGKSYTMGTAEDSSSIVDQNSMGITARAATELFTQIANKTRTYNSVENPWAVSVTYLEIYNEQLRDLLSSNHKNNITIREDVKGNIYVQGLKEVVVDNVEQLLAILQQGSSVRQVNSTAVNSQSSRSHAIFTVHLTHKQVNPETGIVTTLTSKLNFVDLAGSERIKNTGVAPNEGRLKEGISINSGLTALGKVISQLSTTHPGAHVSYRDSKLTRVLQDSLGGKAITFLIACITTENYYVSETINTLSYAQRARAIQVTPEIQQADSSKEDMIATITQLQRELQFWKAKSGLDHSFGSPLSDRKLVENHNGLSPLIPSTPSTPSSRFQHTLDIPIALDSAHGFVIDSISSIGSAESSRDRINRSTAFHSAVESIIADYEQTVASLQESVSVTKTSNFDLTVLLQEKEERFEHVENANEQLSLLVEKQQATISELKIRLETYTDDPSDLQKEVIKLRAELNAHRKDQKRHLSESQYLTAQYNNARREVERLTREKEAIEIRTRKLRAYLLKNNPEFDDDGSIFSDDLTTESGESNGPDTPPSIRRSSLLDEQKSHGKRVSSTSSSGSSSSFFVSASVT